MSFVVCLVGSRTPSNETGPEVREWKDHLKTRAIGMDLVQTKEAMIVEAESYPAPVGRIGTHKGADVSTFIIRYEMKLFSVGTDGHDVCGDSGDGDISIDTENKVLTVWRPILLNRDVETEGGDLEHMATIDVRREERRSGRVSVKAKETDFFPLGETFGSAQHGPMRCRLSPLRSMLQKASSLVAGSIRSNMIRVPSGVKEGSPSQTPGTGNSIRPLPSAFMIATLPHSPGASCSKTIPRHAHLGTKLAQQHRHLET